MNNGKIYSPLFSTTALETPVTVSPVSFKAGEFWISLFMLDAKEPESMELVILSNSFSSVVVIVATTTIPLLVVRDELLSCKSIDELETPRDFATEFIKSLFTASKLDSVKPSNVISVCTDAVTIVVKETYKLRMRYRGFLI